MIDFLITLVDMIDKTLDFIEEKTLRINELVL